MSVDLVQEALHNAIAATNNATIYTNIVLSTADALSNYSSVLEQLKSNRVAFYLLQKNKKKKLTSLIDQINEYESFLKKQDLDSSSIDSIIHSFNIPISQPIDTIKKSMDSIYDSFKHLGLDVPKFTILDADLTDDLVSLYGIFATNDSNSQIAQKLQEVKEFMQNHGISLPSTNIKNVSLDDFFFDISKFKLDHSQLRKKKLVMSKPDGDYYNGTYTKNDEVRKVTIIEIPEYSTNLEKFQREVSSLSSISHPNIIEFIGATSTPPYCIVTARHGKTLRHYLQQSDPSKKSDKMKTTSNLLIHPSYFVEDIDRQEKEKENKKGENQNEKDDNKEPLKAKLNQEKIREKRELQQVEEKIHLKASSFSVNDLILDNTNNDNSQPHLIDDTSNGTTDTENNYSEQKPKKHKKKHTVITGTEKAVIAYKIAEAMSYVHSKNILHRNLSCNTIVLDKAMNPYIIDFSTSRFFPEDESLLLTVGVGSEQAKAPELTSDTRYSYEIDVFSFGMMLYEMLTCEIPFGKMSSTEAASAILSGKRPDIPANTQKKLSDLISRCWHPNAKDRPTFIQLVNEIPYSKIMFPDSDEQKVLQFYRSVSVKSNNVQYCIDFMEQICGDIDEIIVFKHEAVRIRALLCGYILELKKSKAAKNSEEEDLETALDINNLMTALSRLSTAIKNITSPIWETNALNNPATAPIDDINESLDSLVVPLAQLGLNVEKYKPKKVDLALDFRILYSTFKSNENGGNLNVEKRIIEVENFMKENGITIVPSQHEIDKRISSVFKNYDNFIVRHSDFEKLKLIGSGATSDVYLGTQKSTQNKVAIKEFNEDYLLAEKCGFYLHREIFALSTLHHEYLANFIGATKTNPIWIVNEYVENGDLESHIEDGSLSPIQKTVIMYEVAEGMAYLQSMKMIHRDLKSKNVLLDANLEPKIVDFGFTRHFSSTMSMAVGTPIYMAPEVIKSSYYDYKADVFSFALMVSEMITGFKPFLQYSNDPLTIQQYILDGLRPTFDEDLGVSEEMKELLEQMWEDDYKKRPDFNTILQIMREKKITFPGAEETDVSDFYDRKENKASSRPLASLKRRASFFLNVQ